jgi:hypothetical protein
LPEKIWQFSQGLYILSETGRAPPVPQKNSPTALNATQS